MHKSIHSTFIVLFSCIFASACGGQLSVQSARHSSNTESCACGGNTVAAGCEITTVLQLHQIADGTLDTKTPSTTADLQLVVPQKHANDIVVDTYTADISDGKATINWTVPDRDTLVGISREPRISFHFAPVDTTDRTITDEAIGYFSTLEADEHLRPMCHYLTMDPEPTLTAEFRSPVEDEHIVTFFVYKVEDSNFEINDIYGIIAGNSNEESDIFEAQASEDRKTFTAPYNFLESDAKFTCDFVFQSQITDPTQPESGQLRDKGYPSLPWRELCSR